ncbi:MAG: DUF3737 family protein [Tannerellaceae bacterium]|nr:DUF3737 family protein [Tannerellaceae bacterium]
MEAYKCEFMCKYPFWHNDHTLIEDCLFTVYSRAAIWYSKNIRMVNTWVDAPKMFREINGHITSIKNPGTGFISAESIGEIIFDENCKHPGECDIRFVKKTHLA